MNAILAFVTMEVSAPLSHMGATTAVGTRLDAVIEQWLSGRSWRGSGALLERYV